MALIVIRGNVVEAPDREVENCPECGEHTLVTINPWDGTGDWEPSTTECTNCFYNPEEE